MKKILPRLATLFAVMAFALLSPACTEDSDHDHDHDGHHEHDDHKHGEGHKDDHDDHGHEDGHKDDHAEHKDHDHDHDHDHGHSHDSIEAGPNGGRILHDIEPHVEFLVTDDRKVKISAVNDDGKIVPVTTQTVSLIGGSRANPTRMKFTKEDGALVSDIAFPNGNDFPVVVQLKASPDDKAATVKFNLNLEDCPSCDNKEYACECDHEH